MRKIGIVCAADEELAPFLGHIDHMEETEKAKLRFYAGTIGGMPVVALFSGVGKVNAAIAAQILIDTYGVDTIVNAGTAGGMAQEVGLLDTVIGTQCAYHDMDGDILTDFHPWMPTAFFEADAALLDTARAVFGQDPTVHLGRMVTGESFITNTTRGSILERFAPLSVDMETASIAHVCHVNQIPFLAVRSITDTAEHAGQEHFEQNCQRASIQAKDAVLALLAALSCQRA